jgi:hypothetical protein
MVVAHLHVWEEALFEFIQVAHDHVASGCLLLKAASADGQHLQQHHRETSIAGCFNSFSKALQA